MPRILSCLLLLVALLIPASHRTRAEEPLPPKGFVALCNGKDLDDWHGRAHFDPYKLERMAEEERKKQIAAWTQDAHKHWRIAGGELVSDGQGVHLATDREFGDVELLVEYRPAPKARAAIALRGADLKWDGEAVRPGEWNSLRIVQVGERTTVHLDGKVVVNHARIENPWNRELPLRRTGPVQLQAQGGEVRWRHLFIREIPSEEANALLRKHRSEGFVDVFNGKDFTGWAGPIDQYEVKEGAIVCRPKKGGNI
jgi:hypothetical protein